MNNIQQVIEEIDEFNADELRQIQAAIVTRLESVESEQEREARFDEELLRKGIVSSIPDRSKTTPASQRPDLLTIDGPPLSETIIQERR